MAKGKGKNAKTRAGAPPPRQVKTSRGARLPERLPKTAGAPGRRDPQHQTPNFSFSDADHRSTREWRFAPAAEHAGELIAFMCEMSRLTWAEIERQTTGGRGGRHRKHHSMEISTLKKDAQDYIANAGLDEIFGDEIFRFRLSGERRLWGFRTGRLFHAVWWDPEHAVYKVTKD